MAVRLASIAKEKSQNQCELFQSRHLSMNSRMNSSADNSKVRLHISGIDDFDPLQRFLWKSTQGFSQCQASKSVPSAKFHIKDPFEARFDLWLILSRAFMASHLHVNHSLFRGSYRTNCYSFHIFWKCSVPATSPAKARTQRCWISYCK